MDAFYAAVEQRDRPELRGKPVIVGGMGRRGVVSTASYEARPFGVHSAMPSEEARRLCPQGIFVPPDFKRYEEASIRVMEVFGRFSPKVEPLSLDEAFLDMTGAEGLFGPPREMGRRIKEAVREATGGLTVSVGAAPCKYVAKVASDFRKPDGLTIVSPAEVHDFLWPLPVSRLWGVGPKSQVRLESLGLRTIGDVAAAGEAYLKARLGELGPHIRRLAWGEDEREVEPDREAKSVGSEVTLDEDVLGESEIEPHLRRAAAIVARKLRQDGIAAEGIRVKLKTHQFRLLTRQRAVSPPTDSEHELFTAACSLLPEFDLEVPMRLVGLAAYDLSPSGAARQASLFEEAQRDERRKLDRTLDGLRQRFGQDAIRWADERETKRIHHRGTESTEEE
jgi:DNA polymerase-4